MTIKHGSGKMKHQSGPGLFSSILTPHQGSLTACQAPSLARRCVLACAKCEASPSGEIAPPTAAAANGVWPGPLDSLTTIGTTRKPQPVLPKTVESPPCRNHELRRLTKQYRSSLAAPSLYWALKSDDRPNYLTAKGTSAPSFSTLSFPLSPLPQRCLCLGTRRLGCWVSRSGWPTMPGPSVSAALTTMSQ